MCRIKRDERVGHNRIPEELPTLRRMQCDSELALTGWTIVFVSISATLLVDAISQEDSVLGRDGLRFFTAEGISLTQLESFHNYALVSVFQCSSYRLPCECQQRLSW